MQRRTLFSALQHALDLQLAVANILQLLVNSERNQQVLCEACLHQRLLQRCSQALGDEDHPLHPPLQRMFERLASQALHPMALRYMERAVSALALSLISFSLPFEKAQSGTFKWYVMKSTLGNNCCVIAIAKTLFS